VALNQTISDSFTRSDNTDLGANWDAGYTTRMDLVGNKVRASLVTTNESDETYVSTLPADQWAQITISTWAADANAKYAWLMLRATGPSTLTWYQATIARNEGAFRTQISKKSAGLETSIASENVTTWAATDILRFRVAGTALQLDRNGSSLLTGSDGTLTGNGRVGIGVYLAAGSAGDVELDNFLAGNIFNPVWGRGANQMLGVRVP